MFLLFLIEFVNTLFSENKKSTLITRFNFINDLTLVLSKYWSERAKYKIELAQKKISDVCNSLSYKKKQLGLAVNNIAMILFIDGAAFTNTGKDTTWAIVAMIADLPPRIRSSFFNIIKFVFITSRLFNFNAILQKQMDRLKELLKNGVKIGGKLINV